MFIKSWSYLPAGGTLHHMGSEKAYCEPWEKECIVTMILETGTKSLSYEVNGRNKGVGFENIKASHLRFAISIGSGAVEVLE